MHHILLAKANDKALDSKTLYGMFRFRHKVFYETLGWDVESLNGMERDCYDELNPVYMVAKNLHQDIEGCWRLLPTTGPYMLKDTFPQLLCGEEAPQDPVIWELSRLAVMPTHSQERAQVAFNTLTFAMMQCVVDFAEQHSIKQYILVTSVALERLLKRTGIPIYRLGNHKAQKVGKILTVACWIDINDQTRKAVYSNHAASDISRIAA